MKSTYIKLVIAGRRSIASINAKDIVDVAVGVIIKGAEDGVEYITIEDVPDKYKAKVIEGLEAEGYKENGEPIA